MGSPPTASQWNGLVRTYALCTAVIFIKYFFVQIWSADKEKKHLPEDRSLPNPLKNPSEEIFDRRQKVWNNDKENIPFHWAIFTGAVLVQNLANWSGNGQRETVALTVFLVTYTAGRILHSFAFAYGLQPWRSIVFMLSMFSIFGAVSLLVAAAFYTDAAVAFGASN
jgi:uncharacterized MAPEG superfamily protein